MHVGYLETSHAVLNMLPKTPEFVFEHLHFAPTRPVQAPRDDLGPHKTPRRPTRPAQVQRDPRVHMRTGGGGGGGGGSEPLWNKACAIRRLPQME